MTYEELENKIKSMTAKEIILKMLDGLKNPVMKVNMDTFGEKIGEVCFGCAATNMICKLGELNPYEEVGGTRNSTQYNMSSSFLSVFEDAINDLRSGYLYEYNGAASYKGFTQIKITTQPPAITNDNYKDPEVLQAYIDLANEQ